MSRTWYAFLALGLQLTGCDPREEAMDGPICGDGIIEGTQFAGEQCEGDDLDGKTCLDLGFAEGGTLACEDCLFDVSGCSSQCGNGIVEPTEQCDGDAFADAYVRPEPTCVGYSYWFVDGNLGCKDDCRVDISDCKEPMCGNGVIELGEECEGTSKDLTACEEFDDSTWDSGALVCGDDCHFDTSGCVPRCGNGKIDPGEDCDGDLRSPEFAGKSCKDIEHPWRQFPLDQQVNWGSGDLRCGGCLIWYDTCEPQPGCYWKPQGVSLARSYTVECY